ncbi:hypothetical protein RZN25_07970 [Bacillaceae bacterium S4-13-56]
MTSEYQESDEQIVVLYRGLRKIEESFKVTKSDLENQPIYLSSQEHIEIHSLTCFVSLLIVRVLERRLKRKYLVRTLDSL